LAKFEISVRVVIIFLDFEFFDELSILVFHELSIWAYYLSVEGVKNLNVVKIPLLVHIENQFEEVGFHFNGTPTATTGDAVRHGQALQLSLRFAFVLWLFVTTEEI
jgi:hypothetical protein